MVHFVGAGPGAPDLITLRGAELLRGADCVIYAGSLVNPALLGLCRDSARIYDSARMTLEQVLEVVERAEAAGPEYTLPGVSQTVIITRMAGRTPVPEGEEIASLARHGATMVIFLSAGMLEALSARLMEGGYRSDAPAALVYKATWPEEKVVRCTVGELAQAGRDHQISRTALVVVGDILAGPYDRSQLYHPGFSTGYREASQ